MYKIYKNFLVNYNQNVVYKEESARGEKEDKEGGNGRKEREGARKRVGEEYMYTCSISSSKSRRAHLFGTGCSCMTGALSNYTFASTNVN